MSNSELNNTLYKLSSLSKWAKENKVFQFESLAHHLNVEFLKDCYKNLDRNKAVNFLGFTHFCDKMRKGSFKIGRKTAMKKFRAKIKELNIWLKQIRNLIPTKKWWKTLQAKLRGHFEYYGVNENSLSIKSPTH